MKLNRARPPVLKSYRLKRLPKFLRERQSVKAPRQAHFILLKRTYLRDIEGYCQRVISSMPAVHALLGRSFCRSSAESWAFGQSCKRSCSNKNPSRLSRSYCKRRKVSLEASAVAEGQLSQWLDLPADKTLAIEDGNEGR